jgi:hypothetical protein
MAKMLFFDLTYIIGVLFLFILWLIGKIDDYQLIKHSFIFLIINLIVALYEYGII